MSYFIRVLGVLSLMVLFNAIVIAETSEDEKFRVCADPNNPPYSNRKGGGFENKIASLFAKKLGKSIEYTWFPQRMGFIRNTLKKKISEEDRFKCDYVMGVPMGYELTLTTKPYYHSTYALVVAKHRGWDDLKTPEDLANLAPKRKQNLRIAMFDKGPGTAWLHNNGFIENGVPYQTMTGDATMNVALTIEKELKNRVVDMAILWGPVAGYLVSNSPRDYFALIPMKSQPGLKFDFPISMGVRYGEKARKAELNGLIESNAPQIKAIMKKYNVPLVEN